MPLWSSGYLFPRCSPPTNSSFIEGSHPPSSLPMWHFILPLHVIEGSRSGKQDMKRGFYLAEKPVSPSSGYTKGPWTETNTPKKHRACFLLDSSRFSLSIAGSLNHLLHPPSAHILCQCHCSEHRGEAGPWCHALPSDTCWAIVRVNNHPHIHFP